MMKSISYVFSLFSAAALLFLFVPGVHADVREPGQSWADYWAGTPSLKEAWKDHFLLGNIYRTFGGGTGGGVRAIEEDDGAQHAILRHHFNALTAENAMKPSSLSRGGAGTDPVSESSEWEGGDGTFRWNFAPADAWMEFAKQNDIAIIGHTLVWHSQSPAWINGGAQGFGGARGPGGPAREPETVSPENDANAYTRARARANMEFYIKTVVEHFDQWKTKDGAGRVLLAWDVVNEALSDRIQWPADAPPGQWRNYMRSPRQSGWIRAYSNGMKDGEHPSDFIYDAFRFARKYTDATLYYNDYGLNDDSKASAAAQMVRELNAQWATDKANNPEAVTDANEYKGRKLIEGIGMQGHYNILNTTVDSVERNIKRFIELGVEISITEFDLCVFTSAGGVALGNRGAYVDLRDRTAEQLVDNTENQRQRYYWRDRGVTTGAEVERIQAIRYAEYFAMFKKYSDHIKRVTFWGCRDSDSWLRNRNPLLWNSDYSAKESFEAVLDPSGYLEKRRQESGDRR